MSNSTAVTVKVVVRVRPQNKIETARGGAPCVEISADGTEVAVEDGYNSQKWSFDRVFKPDSRQQDVFEFGGLPGEFFFFFFFRSFCCLFFVFFSFFF
jgi:hypothetical protein